MTEAVIIIAIAILLLVAAVVLVELYNEVWRWWKFRQAEKQREREWALWTKRQRDSDWLP